MQKKSAIKNGIIAFLRVVSSLVSVRYAFAYTEKREVICSDNISIDEKEVKFISFNLIFTCGII